MKDASPLDVLNDLLEPLSRCLDAESARRVAEYRIAPDVTGIDPVGKEIVALFHPRRDEWSQHFRFNGLHIEGITPTGRATVRLLTLNDARRLEFRAELIARGEL